MNIENPLKYSLQVTTLESIKSYSLFHNISFRRASFIAFSHLVGSEVCCGFNLKSANQFYNSLKRFMNSNKFKNEPFKKKF